MSDNGLPEPTRYDSPYHRADAILRRALLEHPLVIDALAALDDSRVLVPRRGSRRRRGSYPSLEEIGRLQITETSLGGALSWDEIDYCAAMIRQRIRAGCWALVVPVGAGQRYGRQEPRVRRGPTDGVILRAADALARRLDAGRRGERPVGETDIDRRAISDVLRFLGRKPMEREAPQRQPAGSSRAEIERAEHQRARVARRRAQRRAKRTAPERSAAQARIDQEIAAGRLARYPIPGCEGCLYAPWGLSSRLPSPFGDAPSPPVKSAGPASTVRVRRVDPADAQRPDFDAFASRS